MNSSEHKEKISKDKAIGELFEQVKQVSLDTEISPEAIVTLLQQFQFKEKQNNIPLCIFNKGKLSPLESTIKYLRENKKLSFIEIGSLINRQAIPIGITYRRAQKKNPLFYKLTSLEVIPVSIFAHAKLSAFEAIVQYLSKQGKNLAEIARLLGKDQRTIWTVLHRARRKLQ